MSGADGEGGPLKKRFQSGASINWGQVANALFGSALTLVVMTIVDGFLLVQRAVTVGLNSISSFVAAVISLPFDLSAGVFETGADAFAGWVSFLGPLAFPASVIVAIGSLSIILWGVSRLNG